MLQLVDMIPEPAAFEDFWLLFPRKEAKKDARKVWDRMSSTDRVAALVGVVEWRRVWMAQQRDSKFIALPSTWLYGERWTDEVPTEYIAASHAPAKLPVTERTEMPQSVKDAIARLRK